MDGYAVFQNIMLKNGQSFIIDKMPDEFFNNRNSMVYLFDIGELTEDKSPKFTCRFHMRDIVAHGNLQTTDELKEDEFKTFNNGKFYGNHVYKTLVVPL